MFVFFKSQSRTVHEEGTRQDFKFKSDEKNPKVSLTVWRKSLVVSCNGFTVIDSNGDLVYRVDNYCQHPEEVILMDASGNPVLTMCRSKKLRLVESWLVYEGEIGDCNSKTRESKRPICYVKRQKKIVKESPKVIAYVYKGKSETKKYAYYVEGSYTKRSCKVVDESREVVAEIKRKEAIQGGISFGFEVFLLVVLPGFDPSFAMALVLLLDQMCS